MIEKEETESHSFDTRPTGHKDGLILLLLGAMGVVYGDIGTSPIYAFKTAISLGATENIAQPIEVFGIISLIFWALLFVVSFKYIMFVLRADNRGEGGILSLVALVRSSFSGRVTWLTLLGILGAALFFGDAVITPAVSVLSAVEGLEVLAPSLQNFVVPITIVILVMLFSFQRLGTEKVAIIFGPVTFLWFLVLGLLGLINIIDSPEILWGLMPWYGYNYILTHPLIAFATLGAIFLAVTGAEALYVDLGHFGRKPIVLAWFLVVFPCLLLNYMGQGAFVLAHGGEIKNPFFEMVPEWGLLPMIIFATIATVIASQAMLTGAFSMAHQAVQLNLLPRLEVLHTSEKNSGHIYIPRINFLMAAIVLLLVTFFGESSKLAAAYGITVTGNMIVTTILLSLAMSRLWKWKLSIILLLAGSFIFVDLLFFSANLFKIIDGGWASVCISAILVIIMWIWTKGSRALANRVHAAEVPLEYVVEKMKKTPPFIAAGTAVFLTGDPRTAPHALMHSLKHYKVIFENNVILTVVTATTPRVSRGERISVSQFNERFMLVTVTFGYMEQPNLPRALALGRKLGLNFDILKTSFFLSRRSLKKSANSDMTGWQNTGFLLLSRTAADATEYFQIPTGRVVEIGTQITI
ncbi:potassium transporter Kup [Bartonella sp. DGB1]|uniref:potassium transporter Kup n=1 Tax=Bartonella sp. DGB1 TaxID=3239807 RepID=UPI0035237336